MPPRCWDTHKVTKTATCWANRASNPAPASALARRATPSGNVQVGRSRTPARCTGINRERLNTATPRVVPSASAMEARLGSRARSFPFPCARAPNIRYAAITTRLDNSGAKTTPRKRRCAWSTPARTIPTPYRAIWGEKTTIIDAMRSVEPEHLWSSTMNDASGRAEAAIRMDSGTSTARVQVSMAEAVCAASAEF